VGELCRNMEMSVRRLPRLWMSQSKNVRFSGECALTAN